MRKKYAIGKLSQRLHDGFVDKYPEDYDAIVDIVETIDASDIEVFLQVVALECIREQYMRQH